MRIDRRKLTQRRSCRCEDQVRISAYPALATSRRTPSGPRQTILLRLPVLSTCCSRDETWQRRYWIEVGERLDAAGDALADDRSEVLRTIALGLSRFLGWPREAPPPGDPRVLAPWEEASAGTFRHLEATPDLERWEVLPSELQPVREARRVKAKLEWGVDRGLSLADWRALGSQLGGTLSSDALSGPVHRLVAATSPDEVRVHVQEILAEADELLVEARHPPAPHLARTLRRSARRRVRTFIESLGELPPLRRARAFFRSPSPSTSPSTSSSGDEAVRSPRLDAAAHLATHPPARLVAVARYLEGRTQAEIGREVFPDLVAASAQQAVSRHLFAFRRALRRARGANPPPTTLDSP